MTINLESFFGACHFERIHSLAKKNGNIDFLDDPALSLSVQKQGVSTSIQFH